MDIPAVGGYAVAFASDTVAVEYMDGTLGLADCFGWMKNPPSGTVFTADNSTEDELILGASYGGTANATQYAQIDVTSGTSLTISWSLGSSGTGTIAIFECDGTPVESEPISGSSGSFTFAPLAAGQYIIACNADCSSSAQFDIVSDDTMVVNPALSSFLEGVDTWKLEQCPEYEWPLFNSEFGTPQPPFTDLAAATAALARTPDFNSEFPYDCVGLAFFGTGFPSILNTCSAAYAALTFTAAGHWNGANVAPFRMTASLSLEKGAVFTVNGTAIFSGFPFLGTQVRVILMLEDFTIASTLFSDINPVGLPATIPISGSFTVLHTGKYYLYMEMIAGTQGGFGGSQDQNFSCTIGSDLSMLVNPLTALYSRDVDCPARLDCELPP